MVTYEVAGAVKQEHRVSHVLLVAGRVLEDKDGVVW